MSKLRQTIADLPPEQYAYLLYAIEHDLSSWVKLPDDHFVGVNVASLPQLKIIEAHGCWAYGVLNE